jgi:regulator of sigma E protease
VTTQFWLYPVAFLGVLTVLVFVHELGHFLVARWNGVKVETFSIGFGPELFGFNDRHGTRWKFAALPLGGYVKMFGDADAASTPSDGVRDMTPEERAVSFFHKRVGQRAAIIAAGPAANFILTFVIFAVLFFFSGNPMPAAVVGGVLPESPAAAAGLAPGDVIVSVDGTPVERFVQLAPRIAAAEGRPVTVEIERAGARSALVVAPRSDSVDQIDGTTVQVWRIGVSPQLEPMSVGAAVVEAGRETVGLVGDMIDGLATLVSGGGSGDDIGGPLRIAQMSGDIASVGFAELVWFLAILSANLGLINLLPVPILDGGHLVFCGIEALRGRPLGARAQEYGFRVGLALVLTLMVVATWNDLVHLQVFQFLAGLLS